VHLLSDWVSPSSRISPQGLRIPAFTTATAHELSRPCGSLEMASCSAVDARPPFRRRDRGTPPFSFGFGEHQDSVVTTDLLGGSTRMKERCAVPSHSICLLTGHTSSSALCGLPRFYNRQRTLAPTSSESSERPTFLPCASLSALFCLNPPLSLIYCTSRLAPRSTNTLKTSRSIPTMASCQWDRLLLTSALLLLTSALL
jgi:hypothetical protein